MSLPYAQRRAEFLARIPPTAVAVIAGAREVRRNSDNHHRFRQPADLFYLTGFAEPEALAVLAPARASTSGPFTLFVRPCDPHKETWYGRRAGLEGAREHYGADQTFDIAELEARSDSTGAASR